MPLRSPDINNNRISSAIIKANYSPRWLSGPAGSALSLQLQTAFLPPVRTSAKALLLGGPDWLPPPLWPINTGIRPPICRSISQTIPQTRLQLLSPALQLASLHIPDLPPTSSTPLSPDPLLQPKGCPSLLMHPGLLSASPTLVFPCSE